jgi:hypothetical protein
MRSLDELLDLSLPVNRKERYYTGTVLPAVICCDDLTHLDRLADLLDTGPVTIRSDPRDCTVAFFTEYGIVESLIGPAANRFTNLPPGKDTPDVVVLITEPDPVLIALEAKLYDKPGPSALRRQLQAQRALLDPVTEQLGTILGHPVRLVHAALLPCAYAHTVSGLGFPVITWEQVRDSYRDVAPRYFHTMLTIALERHPQLVASPIANQDTSLTGAALVQRYVAGDRTYAWMGRGGGLTGSTLDQDITEGRWREIAYQCSTTPVENRNWFSVADFINRLREHDQAPSGGPDPRPEHADAPA